METVRRFASHSNLRIFPRTRAVFAPLHATYADYRALRIVLRIVRVPLGALDEGWLRRHFGEDWGATDGNPEESTHTECHQENAELDYLHSDELEPNVG
jgi:hypothetical protein